MVLKSSISDSVVRLLTLGPLSFARLAFLSSRKEEAGYYTAGLSWGAKNLPWPAIQAYADRIRELLEIERLDPTLQQAQLLLLKRLGSQTNARHAGGGQDSRLVCNHVDWIRLNAEFAFRRQRKPVLDEV